MQLNVPLVKRQIRRVLSRRWVDIRSMAARTWTLCPQETATVPPARFLDGAVEKVKALSPWRDWPTEKALIEGGSITHAASTAHLIENVELTGSHLYCGAAKWQPGFGSEQLLWNAPEPRRRIETASLLSSNAGSHFFGNFLLDDMPLSMLGGEAESCISMVTKPYEHEQGYRALLDAPRADLVSHGRIRRLTLYTDFAQNSSKLARYRTLRARLRQHIPQGSAAAKGRGVYIRRGHTGELRVLENELEIETMLQRLGFEIVDPSTMSADQIARASLDARLVVGVEGSHLSHAIYTVADDGCFLVLQPPERFSLAYKEFTDRLGIGFAFIVGDPSANGFTVAPDDLNRMLEGLL